MRRQMGVEDEVSGTVPSRGRSGASGTPDVPRGYREGGRAGHGRVGRTAHRRELLWNSACGGEQGILHLLNLTKPHYARFNRQARYLGAFAGSRQQDHVRPIENATNVTADDLRMLRFDDDSDTSNDLVDTVYLDRGLMSRNHKATVARPLVSVCTVFEAYFVVLFYKYQSSG